MIHSIEDNRKGESSSGYNCTNNPHSHFRIFMGCRAQVLFPEAYVDVGGGIQSTLSEHHGLLVTVTKQAVRG
jgi:hypothetical protein